MPLSEEQIAAIPDELKQLRQWVWFDIHDGRKIPRTVGDGFGMASPTDPSTWSTFEEVKDLPNPAFCFRSEDPYVFIDLDEVKPKPNESSEEFADRKERAVTLYNNIYENFPSYSERSTSGKGLHIIGKGIVGPGCRRPGVEIYDRERFCIFTGSTLENPQKILPFDAAKLDSLITKMRQGRLQSVGESKPQKEEDEPIINRVAAQTRGALFFQGNMDALNTTGYNKSHSELDHEFIAMLTEESGNLEQVVRIFQNSPMWRSKATPNYIARTFKKITGRLENEREWTKGFRESIEATIPRPPVSLNGNTGSNGNHGSGPTLNGSSNHKNGSVPVSTAPEVNSPITTPTAGLHTSFTPGMHPTKMGARDPGMRLMSDLPEGMVRDLCFAFYHNSLYPLAEVGLLAGFAAFALAVQRGFQGQDGKALNFFAILLAATSAGKSPITDGVPQLLGLVGGQYHRDHWTGELRSEAAFAKTLRDSNRLVMVKTECGNWFSTMTDEKAAGWERGAADALTSLYSCGAGYYALPRSAQADVKDSPSIWRATLSLIGETQPALFWRGIKSQGMSKGFVARFMILEVDQDSIQRKKCETVAISSDLVLRYKELLLEMEKRDKSEEGGTFTNVPLSPEAKVIFEEYCEDCRSRMFNQEETLTTSIWGKLAENALRMATLLGVSRDWKAKNPSVTREQMLWAIKFVEHCAKNTIAKISEQGSGNTTVAERRRVVAEHFHRILGMSAEERQHKYSAYFRHKNLASVTDAVPVALLRFLSEKNKAFTEGGQRNVGDFDSILDALVADGDVGALLDRTTMQKWSGVPVPCVFKPRD